MQSRWKKRFLLVCLCVLLASLLSACQSEPVNRVQACDNQTSPLVTTFQPIASLKQTVYATSGSRLYALQASNGTLRWCSALTLDNGKPDQFTSVTHVGDQLYTFTHAGMVTALTAHSGTEVWSTNTGDLASGSGSRVPSPSVANRTVYSGGASIVALRTQDGSVLWQYTLPNNYDAGTVPLASNGKVYVGGPPNQLFALDAATGHKLWTVSLPPSSYATDLIAGDGVIVIRYTIIESQTSDQFSDGLDVVDAQSGKLLWHKDIDAVLWSMQSIANGLLYAQAVFPANQRDAVNGLYAFDLHTGRVRWSFPTRHTDLALDVPLVVANTRLYMIGRSGNVDAIDALTGQILWSVPLFNPDDVPARLVLCDNELFIGMQDRFVVYAFNVTTRTENWEVNLLGGDARNEISIDVGT